jgi:glyoxylate carboligase
MATDVDHLSTVDKRATATVRDATYDLLRAYGLTTIFGNLGSTEEPFLADYPSDFRYVLGLQEASVIAMADGFAQATRGPALVNLHTGVGLGNSMGNLGTAFQNKTPLIVSAGQQTREMLLLEPYLTNAEPDDGAAAVGQVGVSTPAGAGRAGRVHACDRYRSPASRRTGVPVAAARRLGQAR